MQVSTNTYFRNQNDSIQDLKNEIGVLQQQVATGKKVALPSDDPIAFSTLSRLKAKTLDLAQAGKNIVSAQQRLSLTENALQQVTTTLTRIKELGIQAAQTSTSESDRKNIGAEVGVLSETLIGLANTKNLDGTALFGGYRVTGAPFTQAADGTVTYSGDTADMHQVIGNDQSMVTNLAGGPLFLEVPQADGSKVSIFDTIKTAVDQLKAGNPATSLGTQVDSALTHIGSYLTITGARMDRLTDQIDKNQQDTLETKAQASVLEDTDVDQAITTMKQKMLSLDAAQSSFVKIADLSLFNYLK